MSEAIVPETGSVTINGTLYSFSIRSFKEEGGDKKREFIRTMGRNFRRFKTPTTDLTVNFEITVLDTSYNSLHGTYGSVGSISFDFNGSYTINYFNAYNINLIHEAGAEDYLKGKISFNCTPYDINGSWNRVIS